MQDKSAPVSPETDTAEKPHWHKSWISLKGHTEMNAWIIVCELHATLILDKMIEQALVQAVMYVQSYTYMEMLSAARPHLDPLMCPWYNIQQRQKIMEWSYTILSVSIKLY